jgi:hypothetical protein
MVGYRGPRWQTGPHQVTRASFLTPIHRDSEDSKAGGQTMWRTKLGKMTEKVFTLAYRILDEQLWMTDQLHHQRPERLSFQQIEHNAVTN